MLFGPKLQVAIKITFSQIYVNIDCRGYHKSCGHIYVGIKLLMQNLCEKLF